MDFGNVVHGLKKGRRYRRAGQGATGVFIFLVPGSVFRTNREPLLSVLGDGVEVQYQPHIDQRRADGSICVWAPRQDDMLAEDWEEVQVTE